jgi:hypothetical protein
MEFDARGDVLKSLRFIECKWTIHRVDPLVAEQKRQVHQRWIHDSVGSGVVPKTDLFEEAYGLDRIFYDLFPSARRAIGIDLNSDTVRAAASHDGYARFGPIVCVRQLPFPARCGDVVVSTSTLVTSTTRRAGRADR